MLVTCPSTSALGRLLPQDRLYLLNRYSEAVGEIVRIEGGEPIQFLGDNVMTLFGLEVGPEEANRRALSAAAQLDRHLRGLRDRLAAELGCAAEFIVHLHTGPAGIGETGDHAI